MDAKDTKTKEALLNGLQVFMIFCIKNVSFHVNARPSKLQSLHMKYFGCFILVGSSVNEKKASDIFTEYLSIKLEGNENKNN